MKHSSWEKEKLPVFTAALMTLLWGLSFVPVVISTLNSCKSDGKECRGNDCSNTENRHIHYHHHYVKRHRSSQSLLTWPCLQKDTTSYILLWFYSEFPSLSTCDFRWPVLFSVWNTVSDWFDNKVDFFSSHWAILDFGHLNFSQ